MDHHHSTEIPQGGHGRQDRVVVGHRLTAIGGEHLDGSNAGPCHLGQLVSRRLVPFHYAAVQRRVAQTLACLGALGIRGIDRLLAGSRNGKVHDGGGPTEDRGCRALAIVVQGGEGTRSEANVAVWVDATREYQPARGVEFRRAGRHLAARRQQRLDHPAGDQQVGLALPTRIDHRATPDHQRRNDNRRIVARSCIASHQVAGHRAARYACQPPASLMSTTPGRWSATSRIRIESDPDPSASWITPNSSSTGSRGSSPSRNTS